jgi:quinol-cytochrome oxidoreductase complex cytochrome b subunit
MSVYEYLIIKDVIGVSVFLIFVGYLTYLAKEGIK